MMEELKDIKENKTLEAYFKRFKHIPSEESREKLLK
jgi:hypothetical protein